MNREFLLINCDPATREWLALQLGSDVRLTGCASIDEVARRLRPNQPALAAAQPSSAVAIQASSPSATNGHRRVDHPLLATRLDGHAVGHANGNGHEAASALSMATESHDCCAASNGSADLMRSIAAVIENDSGTLADQVDRFEKLVIQRTLARHDDHRKDTAAELGISRVTLYNKMKKFGMLSSGE